MSKRSRADSPEEDMNSLFERIFAITNTSNAVDDVPLVVGILHDLLERTVQ
jgi:hypothetical protein